MIRLRRFEPYKKGNISLFTNEITLFVNNAWYSLHTNPGVLYVFESLRTLYFIIDKEI